MMTRPLISESSRLMLAPGRALSPLSRVMAPERHESTTRKATPTGTRWTNSPRRWSENCVPARWSSPSSACDEMYNEELVRRLGFAGELLSQHHQRLLQSLGRRSKEGKRILGANRPHLLEHPQHPLGITGGKAQRLVPRSSHVLPNHQRKAARQLRRRCGEDRGKRAGARRAWSRCSYDRSDPEVDPPPPEVSTPGTSLAISDGEATAAPGCLALEQGWLELQHRPPQPLLLLHCRLQLPLHLAALEWQLRKKDEQGERARGDLERWVQSRCCTGGALRSARRQLARFARPPRFRRPPSPRQKGARHFPPRETLSPPPRSEPQVDHPRRELRPATRPL